MSPVIRGLPSGSLAKAVFGGVRNRGGELANKYRVKKPSQTNFF